MFFSYHAVTLMVMANAVFVQYLGLINKRLIHSFFYALLISIATHDHEPVEPTN